MFIFIVMFFNCLQLTNESFKGVWSHIKKKIPDDWESLSAQTLLLLLLCVWKFPVSLNIFFAFVWLFFTLYLNCIIIILLCNFYFELFNEFFFSRIFFIFCSKHQNICFKFINCMLGVATFTPQKRESFLLAMFDWILSLSSHFS